MDDPLIVVHARGCWKYPVDNKFYVLKLYITNNQKKIFLLAFMKIITYIQCKYLYSLHEVFLQSQDSQWKYT